MECEWEMCTICEITEAILRNGVLFLFYFLKKIRLWPLGGCVWRRIFKYDGHKNFQNVHKMCFFSSFGDLLMWPQNWPHDVRADEHRSASKTYEILSFLNTDLLLECVYVCVLGGGSRLKDCSY